MVTAALHNDMHVVRLVFDRYNLPPGFGEECLVEAAKNDGVEMVRFLLDRGVRAYARATKKAAKHDCLKTLTLLLGRGVLVGQSATVAAAMSGSVDALKLLCERGAPCPATIITDVINDGFDRIDRYFGFHLGIDDKGVVLERHRKTLKFLISKNLPIDATATRAAILTGRADILKLLLDRCAPVSLADIMHVGHRHTFYRIKRCVRARVEEGADEKVINNRANEDWKSVYFLISQYTCTPSSWNPHIVMPHSHGIQFGG
jgi:hypothetical protein